MTQLRLDSTSVKKTYVLDIETMKIIHDPTFNFHLLRMGLGFKEKILIGLYDGKTYYQFDNFNKCIEFILKNSLVSIVYAHNGGKYDFLYLLENEIRNYDLGNLISLGSNLIFDLSNKQNRKNKILFRDSFKLLPNSLNKLAKSFLTDTQKIKMNYEAVYTLDEIEKYLEYDCISLYEVIRKFEKEIQTILNDPLFTLEKYISLASMSFYILNHKYLKGKTNNRFSKKLENWIRKAYYGGRTEIFRFSNVGKFGESIPLNYGDVNSLYPFVMKDNYYPIGRYKVVVDSDKTKEWFISGKLGIVKANIYYPFNYLTCLPYRIDKKLMFPYGVFTGYYTTEEIKVAISEGASIDFIQGVFWTKKEKIFEKFVNDFYSMKQNSTGAKKEIAKLILNSSYGKMAQKRKNKEIISRKEYLRRKVRLVEKNLLDEYDVLGKELFYSKDKVSYANRKVNPLYAVFITSYARLYLFKLMKQIGIENLYYCDTDSIICSGDIPKEFLHESEIGKVKKEVDIINQAYFISPKFYALDYMKNGKRLRSIKIKGVDRSIIKSLSMEQFKQIVKDHRYLYTVKRMVSFRQKFSMVKYRNDENFVNMEEFEKELSCDYDKRIRNGNESEPLKVINTS